MTVYKQQYKQYLEELDRLFTEKIFENILSFKKLISPGCTDVMEVWYSGSDVLVFCEFEERAAVYETVDAEAFVDWLDSLEEDGPEAA